MATGVPVAFAIGLILANSFGWGWPGLANLSIARRFPTSTAAASGVSQTGVSIGLLLGPALLGVLATSQGWVITWTTAAVCGLLGALTILWVSRHLNGPVPMDVVASSPQPAPRPTAGL